MKNSVTIEGQDSPLLANILYDVLVEGEKAQEKHGTPSPNPLRGITILTEEVGEAAEAALKATSLNEKEKEDEHGVAQPMGYWLVRLRAELVQTASVSIRQIQNIDNGRMHKCLKDQEISES